MYTTTKTVRGPKINTRALRRTEHHIHDHTTRSFANTFPDILVCHDHITFTNDSKEHRRHQTSRTGGHTSYSFPKIIVKFRSVVKVDISFNHNDTPCPPTARFRTVSDGILCQIVDLHPATHTMCLQVGSDGNHTRSHARPGREMTRTKLVILFQVIDSHHIARKPIVSSSNIGRLTPLVRHKLETTVEYVPKHIQTRIIDRPARVGRCKHTTREQNGLGQVSKRKKIHTTKR